MASWKLKWKLKVSYSKTLNSQVLALHAESSDQLEKCSEWLDNQNGLYSNKPSWLTRNFLQHLLPAGRTLRRTHSFFQNCLVASSHPKQHVSTTTAHLFPTSPFSTRYMIFCLCVFLCSPVIAIYTNSTVTILRALHRFLHLIFITTL